MAGVVPTTRQERRVLGFCNRIRKDVGKKPRKTIEKGLVHGTSGQCPVALTIGSGANVGYYKLGVNNKEYTNPEYVQNFIYRFDNEKLNKFAKDRE